MQFSLVIPCRSTGSKPLKNSKRIKLWKIDLIEQQNPEWIDLYNTFFTALEIGVI
jgi:hypothetical protein